MEKIISLPWQKIKEEPLDITLAKKAKMVILMHLQSYIKFTRYIYIKLLIAMLKMKIKL